MLVKDKSWSFGMEPDGVADFLGVYEWRVLELLGYEELAERYLKPTGRKLLSMAIESLIFAEKQQMMAGIHLTSHPSPPASPERLETAGRGLRQGELIAGRGSKPAENPANGGRKRVVSGWKPFKHDKAIEAEI